MVGLGDIGGAVCNHYSVVNFRVDAKVPRSGANGQVLGSGWLG